MSDFAKSQLMKYGWTEGKGLGKYESGITEPLKQKLKFDTAGVGYKDTDWNNWWEHAFNKAASSIKVESQADEVMISVSKENTTNDLPKEELNKNESKYGNFLKTTTLLNGNLILENNSNMHKKQENIKPVSLTDEELFKLCGGRTAHKGARHGLQLNGKLKRIAQQEKYLLNTIKLENNIVSQNNEYEEINDENIVLPMASTESVMIPKRCKTTNRKNKRLINNLSHQLNISCNINGSDKKNIHATVKGKLKRENEGKKKRKKKRRSSIPCDIESAEKEKDNTLNYVVYSVAKKNIQDQVNDHNENKYTDTPSPTKKSKKKKDKLKKKEDQDDECDFINVLDPWEDELDGSQAKKFKRLLKNDSDISLFADEDIDILGTKFQTELSCNELPVEQVDTAKTLPDISDAYFKKKADYLNTKIKKKKLSKLHKKEKIKLAKLAESLEAVHFNTEESAPKKYTKLKLNGRLGQLCKVCIVWKGSNLEEEEEKRDS